MDCRNIRHCIVIGILLLRSQCSCHNVDIVRPIVRFDPMPEPGDTLFGYSVAFHRGNDNRYSMLVGAPRAQTSQPGVERGGAVYRCPVENDDCEQLSFDSTGDPVDGRGNRKGSKSNQFFGATLNNAEPDGPVVACAPRREWFNSSDIARYFTGACFVTDNDFSTVQEYTQCDKEIVSECLTPGAGISNYQAGFSASISKDGKMLLGAPGSFFWQGQLISIDPNNPADAVYTAERHHSNDNSYQGYTTTRGRFGPKGIYAVAIPRAVDFLGMVSFFDEDLLLVDIIEGEQMSAYFGYSLVASDLNADGFDDLIVGAPMFLDPDNLLDRWEVGRVYVYCQNAEGSFEKTNVLTGTSAGGQFGFAIAALGDINRDGFNDIAVGAPFADSGIVYIYHGRRRGIKQIPSQVLRPVDFGLNILSFGTSLAGGSDVDGNFYNDILIGAYMSSAVVLARSRPIVRIEPSLTFEPKQINLDTRDFTLPSGHRVSSFNITTCLTARGLDIPELVAIKYSLQLDAALSTSSRAAFVLDNSLDQSELTRTVELVTDIEMCQKDLIYVKLVILDKIHPIAVRLSYELDPDATSAQYDDPWNVSTPVPPTLISSVHPAVLESLLIRNTCKNYLCVPDLRLTASSNTKRIVVGDNWEATVEVSVTNYGEDAYEASFHTVLPDGVAFLRVERISTDLSVTCNFDEDDGNVKCDIGNPLPEDHTVEFRLTLANDQLSGDNDGLVISMNVGSLNYEPVNITADNHANITIGVSAYAELGIYGGSNPPQVLYRRPNSSFVPPEPKTEEDVGPEVEHVYLLRNLGPSKVGLTRVDIYWPLVNSDGGYLLYVTSAKLGTGEDCWVQGGINPDNLELDVTDGNKTSSDFTNLSRKRRQSDNESAMEVLPQVGSEVTIECYQVSPGCVLITCNVSVPSGVGVNEDSSVIRIKSRLYEDTFMKGDYSQVLISSVASASVLAMPYRKTILPDEFAMASSQAATQVIVRSSETPVGPSKEVIIIPLWVYLVAILGGSAILILVVFAMWKCGFFKRKKIVPKSPQAVAEETWQNDVLIDEKN